MANTDAPFGLRPVRTRNGSPWNGAATPYYCDAGYGTALYVGDPVVVVGDSNDNEIMGFSPGSLSQIEKATAGDGNAITGVIVGFLPVTHESLVYRAASTERIAMVCDDPNVVFEIQSDGGSVTADTVGLNAVLIFTHAGSTVTGRSGVELDTTSDTPDADASNQLLILAFSKGTEIGAYAKFDVLINQHTQAPGALGIA